MPVGEPCHDLRQREGTSWPPRLPERKALGDVVDEEQLFIVHGHRCAISSAGSPHTQLPERSTQLSGTELGKRYPLCTSRRTTPSPPGTRWSSSTRIAPAISLNTSRKRRSP